MSQSAAVKQIDFKKVKIPPRPEALLTISEQMKLPEPNINVIAEAIHSDVSLAGAVLQVVNSPFFALRRKLTSVHQATTLLGVNKVSKLVTAVAMRAQVSQKLDLGRFWDSAEEIAQLSSAIAKKLGGVDAEDAYMLGLFHDAGIPIMMQHFDNYKETLKKANTGEIAELTQYEMEQYGIDHASIGYKLAEEWFLGEDLCEAILYHHECQEVFNQEDASSSPAVSLLGILKFAEHIHFELHKAARSDLQTDWENMGDAIMGYLNWSANDMDELRDDIMEMLQQGD